MKFPDQPNGLHDLPTFARDLRNYLRSITVRPSRFIRVSQTANGTVLEPVFPRTEEGDQASSPWALGSSVESGPVYKITVSPGMVGNFIPTIGGTSIAAATPPELTVTGSSGVVYLKAVVDAAGAISSLIIDSASSIPADTTTDKHKLIGTWTASGGAFTSVVSILNANQTLYICGGTAIWEA